MKYRIPAAKRLMALLKIISARKAAVTFMAIIVCVCIFMAMVYLEVRYQKKAMRKSDDSPFAQAILNEDVVAVRELLRQGEDPNTRTFVRESGDTFIVKPCNHLAARDDYLKSALMVAAAKGSLPIVEALIQSGADVNMVTASGSTALHHAIHKGNVDIVEHLLNSGAFVDLHKAGDDTPLILAANIGEERIVELFLARGADVNVQSDGGVTALMLAAECGHTHIVESLIAHGANVNARDDEGRTALWEARTHGNAETVAHLLNSGAVE